MLDACMRWLFQLPLHSNCPLLHSLLLLWHTCCAYGIATNAFADVAHKLEVMFKAGHYAYEVMLRCTHTHARACAHAITVTQVALLCCAYMRCAALEHATADGVQGEGLGFRVWGLWFAVWGLGLEFLQDLTFESCCFRGTTAA